MKIRLPLALLVLMTAGLARAADSFTVTVTHGLKEARPSETIEIPWKEIASRLPNTPPTHLIVKVAGTGTVLPSQFTNFRPEVREGAYDALLFQHDFAKGEQSASFVIEKSADPVPPYAAKTFARYVPERHDDFAWENDRLAHRMYGQELDTPAAGGSRMISSGIDVWTKRVRYPIVNRWYQMGHDNYHLDSGEGLDFYSVGTSRGCGGLGIWDGKSLAVSHNWKTWKILANGPVRTIFELGYDAWDAAGTKVAETKRFTVDAGHNLHRVESTFTFAGVPAVTVGIGLGKDPRTVSTPTLDADAAWMSRWSKYEKPAEGELGCGIVLADPEVLRGFAEDNQNQLLLATAKSGQPLRYYLGAGWSRSGDFADQAAWSAYLAAFARRIQSPVTLTLSPLATK